MQINIIDKIAVILFISIAGILRQVLALGKDMFIFLWPFTPDWIAFLYPLTQRAGSSTPSIDLQNPNSEVENWREY